MPVVNNTNGSTVGYKYFNFDVLGKADAATLSVRLKPLGTEGRMEVLVGSPYKQKGGRVVATYNLTTGMPQQMTELTARLSGVKGLKGKQPVFFVFSSPEDGKSLCDVYDFIFKTGK